MAPLLIVAGGWLVYKINVPHTEDCRVLPPEEILLFIKHDFMKKNSTPDSLMKGVGPFEENSIIVKRPQMSKNSNQGLDWTSVVTAQSRANKKRYEFSVFYGCDTGLEYSSGKIEEN